jgi:hypothetical protein
MHSDNVITLPMHLQHIRDLIIFGFKNFKKINVLYLHCRTHFTKVILAKILYNNAYYHMLKGTPQLRKHPVYEYVYLVQGKFVLPQAMFSFSVTEMRPTMHALDKSNGQLLFQR